MATNTVVRIIFALQSGSVPYKAFNKDQETRSSQFFKKKTLLISLAHVQHKRMLFSGSSDSPDVLTCEEIRVAERLSTGRLCHLAYGLALTFVGFLHVHADSISAS